MNTAKITCMHKVIRRVAAGDQFADLLPLIELDPPAHWKTYRDMITGAQLVAVGVNRAQLLCELCNVERWVDEQRAAAKVAAGNQEVITWHDASEPNPVNLRDCLVKHRIGTSVGFVVDGEWEHEWGHQFEEVTHWADMPAGPEVAS